MTSYLPNSVFYRFKNIFLAIVHQRWQHYASAMEIKCPSDGNLLPSLMHKCKDSALI